MRAGRGLSLFRFSNPTTLVRATFLLLAPTLIQAQSTGVIAGRVSIGVDSARAQGPATGAGVAIVGTTLGAATGADGRFSIAGVPAGTATLRVRHAGHRPVEQRVRVPAGDTVRVDIVLEPQPQLLTAVRTSALPTDVETFVSKPNVGVLRLTADAMAGVPSVGEPDVARVVQLLPGVVARNDFNTGLNVRGGEPDQNLILLDGHPIYNPFHLGGLFSTFMDATVGGIELLTGAFPARFGGRLSSVLDVRSAEVARTDFHGSADLSAVGATARAAGTFAAGAGTWSAAGRRTYADAVTDLFTDDVFPYHFRDFHARATYALPRDVRLGVTVYAGKDVLDANFAELARDSADTRASEGRWTFDWGNAVAGLSLAKDLGPGTGDAMLGWLVGPDATIEQRISTSGFATRLNVGDGSREQRSEIRDLRVSGTLLARRAAHDLTFGYDAATHWIRYASGSPQTGAREFEIRQRPFAGALWVDDLWRVSPRWLLETGLRAEALSSRQWLALSPRASAKFFVTPRLALTAGAGRVTQWLHSLAGDGPLRYFDIWLASDAHTPVASAWHWVAGVERRLGDAGTLRLEGFLKEYERVFEVNRSDDPQRRGDELLATSGRSYGFDLLARWQPGSGLGGWLAYSYGVSTRARDGERYAPAHDRRHDVDLVATWRVAKYRLGARFGYATGTPYTPIVGEIIRRQYDPSREHWGTGDPRLFIESLGGPRNAARFPAVHRLDLDASREFRVRGATVAPYVSVVNAYNARSVFVYLYNYSTDRPTRRALSQFPVLPSAGVRIAF